MNKTEIFHKGVGSGIKVTDPTVQSPTTDGTNLNTVLENLNAKIASSGGGSFDANAEPAGVAVGGLGNGTAVADKSDHEILMMMIYPEYAPKWTDATATLAAKNIGSIVEVGTTVPAADTTEFTAGGSAAYATGGTNVAHGGAATDTLTCNVETGVAKTTAGTVTYTLSRAYAAGTEVVKTNKGTATNKTASNTTTLLSSASANGNVDATSKTIKAITKTATVNVKFVDAFYANTSAIGTMGKLGLTDASELTLDFPAETAANRQAFSIPASYTGVSIQVYNSLSGKFEAFGGSFTTSSETKTLADGETTKAYTKYTRNETSASPATKFKVTFTKA